MDRRTYGQITVSVAGQDPVGDAVKITAEAPAPGAAPGAV